MSWGTDLWDQYEKVCSHTDQGIEFIKRVSSFVEKRIHVEQSYAKDLRKLVKQFKRKDEEESPYSAVRGFSKLVVETNDLAGQRELISEYLEEEVLNPLRTLAKEIFADRRKHMQTGAELQRMFKNSMDTLDRTKKQYEKASEDAENALHTLERADNDPNSTKAKIDKLTTTLRQKESIMEDCRNTYILQLEKTNEHRQLFFKTDMPSCFKDFQDMNASRIERYKELLSQHSDCHRRVLPVINTCLDNITEASNAISSEKDNQQLIEECKTGFPIPGDVDFEPYQGKQQKRPKASKPKPELKEDLSHLPPEQRRKKLQLKVDQLESLLTKLQADNVALEKMQNIYTQNPKLGDASAVAQSIEVNQRKQVETQADLEKFNMWLTEVKEQLAAEHTGKAAKGSSKAKSSPKIKKKEKDKKKGKDKEKDTISNESHSKNGDSPVLADYGHGDEEDESYSSAAVSNPSPSRASDEWDEEPSVNQTGVMIYDFDAQAEGEMSASANEVVTIVQDLGDGWLTIVKNGEEGYVPKTYVDIN